MLIFINSIHIFFFWWKKKNINEGNSNELQCGIFHVSTSAERKVCVKSDRNHTWDGSSFALHFAHHQPNKKQATGSFARKIKRQNKSSKIQISILAHANVMWEVHAKQKIVTIWIYISWNELRAQIRKFYALTWWAKEMRNSLWIMKKRRRLVGSFGLLFVEKTIAQREYYTSWYLSLVVHSPRTMIHRWLNAIRRKDDGTIHKTFSVLGQQQNDWMQLLCSCVINAEFTYRKQSPNGFLLLESSVRITPNKLVCFPFYHNFLLFYSSMYIMNVSNIRAWWFVCSSSLSLSSWMRE